MKLSLINVKHFSKNPISFQMARNLVTILVTTLCLLNLATCQSNYADQANNVEYQGEGLPEEATLDGKVTKLDDLSPVIFLNRTKAALNCAAGSMQVELKFNEQFYGIAYANFDRDSACQVKGSGQMSYRIEMPLKGCGTKQVSAQIQAFLRKIYNIFFFLGSTKSVHQ